MQSAIHIAQDIPHMNSKEYNWHFVAGSIEELGFGKYDMVQAVVGDRTICIGRFKEEVFAFQSTCPHAGAKMVMGYIDAQGNAVCPLHRFKFSMKTGKNVSGEGYTMRTYPLEFRTDGIFVGFQN